MAFALLSLALPLRAGCPDDPTFSWGPSNTVHGNYWSAVGCPPTVKYAGQGDMIETQAVRLCKAAFCVSAKGDISRFTYRCSVFIQTPQDPFVYFDKGIDQRHIFLSDTNLVGQSDTLQGDNSWAAWKGTGWITFQFSPPLEIPVNKYYAVVIGRTDDALDPANFLMLLGGAKMKDGKPDPEQFIHGVFHDYSPEPRFGAPAFDPGQTTQMNPDYGPGNTWIKLFYDDGSAAGSAPGSVAGQRAPQ